MTEGGVYVPYFFVGLGTLIVVSIEVAGKSSSSQYSVYD